MWLVLSMPRQTSFSVPVREGELVIGRGPSCQLTVQSRSLSRKHIKIKRSGAKIEFQDLASRKGVLLNGQRKKSGRLQVGDKLQLGEVQIVISEKVPDALCDSKTEQIMPPLQYLLTYLCEKDEPRILLEHLLKGLVELFSAERGFVLLKEGGNAKLSPVAKFNIDDEPSFFDVSSTVYGQSLQSQQILHIHNSHEDNRSAQAQSIRAHQWPRSIVCAPLLAEKETIGVIYLDWPMKTEELSSELLQTVDSIAKVTSRLLASNRTRLSLLQERQRLQAINAISREGEHFVLGKSEQSVKLGKTIEAAAPEDVTVLITGETGTGKEMVARAIHQMSARVQGPFVAVNCAALPRDIIEAELFGTEKGAFTGASEQRLGRFELAQGGTLFLDEIGELPLEFQVTMLRTLQERTITRLGGTGEIPLDFRLLCATNAHLEEAIKEGSFRRDFYYRINVFPIILAPLRQRKEDIADLALHFLEYFKTRYNRPIVGFSQEALDALCDYSWPGNIRELRNAIERAVVVERATLVAHSSLPISNLEGKAELAFWQELPKMYDEAKEKFERAFIERSLKEHDGNVTAVANATGMPRRTIYRRLKAYGLLKDRQ